MQQILILLFLSLISCSTKKSSDAINCPDGTNNCVTQENANNGKTPTNSNGTTVDENGNPINPANPNSATDSKNCEETGTCKEQCELQPIEKDIKIDINIETYKVKGVLTLNGGVIPNNTLAPDEGNSRGSIIFREKSSGEQKYINILAKGAVSYELELYKGKYEVFFSPTSANEQNVFPETEVAMITDLEVNEDLIKNFNLETVQISGSLTLNSEMMPNNTSSDSSDANRGSIKFRRKDTGEAISYPISANGPANYVVTIFKGSYLIVLSPNSSSDQNVLPNMDKVLNADYKATNNQEYNFNLETVTLAGELTLNSQTMPNNTKPSNENYSRGSIIFRDTESADENFVSLKANGQASFSTILFKGKYHVSIDPADTENQNVLPEIKTNIEEEFNLNQNINKKFNLDTAIVKGSIKLNNTIMPDNTKESSENSSRGRILFRNASNGDYIDQSIKAKGDASYEHKSPDNNLQSQ